MAHAPVVLNVYNMYWLNEYTSSVGLGVYHSGLEVYGREFAFGGHAFDFTGIFETAPKDIAELGEEFNFKETIALGFTDFTEEDVNNMIEMLGKSYIGSSYHLVERNCNNFSNELCKILTGKTIPNWVNRLATICVRFPFIAACIPKEWLTPEGVTFSNFDLTEWEEIEYPDNNSEEYPDNNSKECPDHNSKEASGEFPDVVSRLNSSTEYHSCSNCFHKSDEIDCCGGSGGTQDHSMEKISLQEMLNELNNKQHISRSPSNDSLITRLDAFDLVTADDKTNNKVDSDMIKKDS